MSETLDRARDVRASMRYVVRGEKSTFHAGDREKSYWPPEDHEVIIHDMRPIREQLSFDRNGFLLADQPSPVPDVEKPNDVARFCRETEQMVRQLTGAAKTISFGPIMRTSAQGTHGHNQPAFGAHVDYGKVTVGDYTRDFFGEEEAERLLAGRYMLINVWRPLIPVESAPLALCDASTVKREDLFDSEVVGGLGGVARSLWGFNLAYQPDHKWYWAPDMQPDEALVFKLYDSDPGVVQFTAHSAFDLPDLPPDAKPRRSIEVRTISYMLD